MPKRFWRRPKREPDLERVQRWLKKTGILSDLEKAEKRFNRKRVINTGSFDTSDIAVATLNVLIKQGLLWPSERSMLVGSTYNPLLVRDDLKNIRTVLRAQLGEIQGRSSRLAFLNNVEELAKLELEWHLNQKSKIGREGGETEKVYNVRVINLLEGIIQTCERMRRRIASLK